MSYIEQVLQASGGSAAPAENLDLSKVKKKKLTLSAKSESALSKKASECGISIDTLRAVYRRAASVYAASASDRMKLHDWAMLRVDAFAVLVASGAPKVSSYVSDNDLLPAGHALAASAVDVDYVTNQLEVTLNEYESYSSKDHAIHSLAEYSGLGYEIIPNIAAVWTRAESAGDDPFLRAMTFVSRLYDSVDSDLLPKRVTDV